MVSFLKILTLLPLGPISFPGVSTRPDPYFLQRQPSVKIHLKKYVHKLYFKSFIKYTFRNSKKYLLASLRKSLVPLSNSIEENNY